MISLTFDDGNNESREIIRLLSLDESERINMSAKLQLEIGNYAGNIRLRLIFYDGTIR